MKLLIITQVVDKEHPILGFFHRWIEEFSKHVEVLHVICLEEGVHNLPKNVRVHSLGKEKGRGRLGYILEFYRLIISLRFEYDRIFVHMNQIYVLLGAPVWKLLKKKMTLWYMHGSRPWSLTLAEKLVAAIYTGSAESFPIASKKVVVTGHGIDTERFTASAAQKTRDLITVGRITAVKNLQGLCAALTVLRNTHPVTLTIVGEARTDSERAYEAALKAQLDRDGLTEIVTFLGKVGQTELPSVLASAKVFVTMAQNGSLDKAMLEAMACGLPVIAMAPGAASLPLGTANTATPEAFTHELKKVLESGVTFVPEYVAYVRGQHSLTTLIPKLLV